MQGRNDIRFTVLFSETVGVFGVFDAATLYRRNGMPLWECLIWLRTAQQARTRTASFNTL